MKPKPIRSVKAAQKRSARQLIEQKVGRPMTNKAAKKWIKRQFRRARVAAEMRTMGAWC